MAFNKSSLSKLIIISGVLALSLFEGATTAAGFSGITDSVGKSVNRVPMLISVCAYIAGAAFIIFGMVRLKEYIDSPSNRPLKNAIGILIIGAALVCLPKTVDIVLTSVDGGQATAFDKGTFQKLQRGIGGKAGGR